MRLIWLASSGLSSAASVAAASAACMVAVGLPTSAVSAALHLLDPQHTTGFTAATHLELAGQFWACIRVNLDCFDFLQAQILHQAFNPLHHDLARPTPGG
jgi:uncharacterized membrane protein YbhN (UPF0104 family)